MNLDPDLIEAESAMHDAESDLDKTELLCRDIEELRDTAKELGSSAFTLLAQAFEKALNDTDKAAKVYDDRRQEFQCLGGKDREDLL